MGQGKPAWHTKQQLRGSGYSRDHSITILVILVELLEVCLAAQVLVVLVHGFTVKDGGTEPGAMGLLAPWVATVMAQVEQLEVLAVLELFIGDLDGRQFLPQLLHPHGGEGGHHRVAPHVIRGHLWCTFCPASRGVESSVLVGGAPVNVTDDLVQSELQIHVHTCRWGRRR